MKTCKVENCINKYYTSGYCCMHYTRMYKNGDLLLHNYSWEWKITLKAAQSPTIKDIAWAAGFYEGEGSACKVKTSIVVSLPQVNLEPIEKMKYLFGGSINKKHNNPKHQLCHEWRIFGSRARGFLMTIYSFLSIKRRDQIKKAIYGQ